MTPQRHLMCLFFSFQAGVRAVKVEQSPSVLNLQEGANCTLSPFNNLRWYTQDTGRGLVSLITMTYNDNKKTPGKREVYNILHMSASHPADSATYFCALHHSALQAPAACPTTPSWAS
uniref:Ig-like domain-containing protein n=1 Tax=Capra hircus TaxID=9925 RepID=A0A8C2S9A0_CAPHI